MAQEIQKARDLKAKHEVGKISDRERCQGIARLQIAYVESGQGSDSDFMHYLYAPERAP